MTKKKLLERLFVIFSYCYSPSMDRILQTPRQLVRATVSFLIVAVVYWLYSLLAVPLIEPVAAERVAKPRAQGESDPSKPKSRHDRLICEAFPDEHAWQRQRPKIVETDQAVLLVQDYRTLDDGRMELKPCTVLFRPKKVGGGADQRVIILDAPGGAQLQFDSSVDIRRGEFGKLIGGRLVGEVTIRSGESQPGAGDALLLTTRNVQMDAERIWTPHEVAFRYGRNYGRGRDLIITLAKKADDDGLGDPEKVDGLSSLEIVHLERLHLETEGNALPTGTDDDPAAKLKGPSQVEVTCRGPFIFDLDRRVASFEDHVDVLRLNANGPSDQLNCRLLEIHFVADNESLSPDPAENAEPPAAQSEPQSVPTEPLSNESKVASSVSKIVAIGHPVVMQSPSMGASARGERLEFDLAKKRFLLEGDRPILLEHEGRRIEARSVQYSMSATSQLGEAVAAGPGRVRATVEGTPPRIVTAQWQDEMRLKPAGAQHVLSLVGNARVGAENMGELAAAEIHLWLNELPEQVAPASRRSATGGTPVPLTEVAKTGRELNIQPDRLLAQGSVKIGSTMLTGSTERFEVWFQNIAPAKTVAVEPASRRSVASVTPVPLPAVTGGTTVPLPRQEEDDKPHSVYDVSGRLLRILLTINGKEMQVRDVSVEGAAQIVETKTAEVGAVPFRLTGDAVHVTGADSPASKALISGNPATISGRGATLRGATVHVDRAANRAWVPGPGDMTLPLDGAQEALLSQRGEAPRPEVGFQQPAKPSPPAIVTWREEMTFDGQTVQLRGDVIARTQVQRVTAPALDVGLTQRINFAEPPQRDAVDVQFVKFLGQVWFENRTIEREELMSIDQMEVRDLVIDNQTGELQATGPGWLKTVRRGGASESGGFAPPAFGGRGARTPAGDAQKDSRLTYLRVTFQQGVTGNVHERHVELHEQVRSVYGKVDRWDATINPDVVDQPDAEVVLLNSDMLQVAQAGQQASGEAAIELQALGNALVEGHAFTARAHRISYAQAKELLVMEGDGRSDAELFRQDNAGGQSGRAAARKMLYWPKTGRLDVDTFNSLDFTGPLGPSGGARVIPEGVSRFLNRPSDTRPPSSTPPR